MSSKYGTWHGERVILQFICAGETAVHCCDPALSVRVILVPRNAFHVVSALQSIALNKIERRSVINFTRIVAQ